MSGGHVRPAPDRARRGRLGWAPAAVLLLAAVGGVQWWLGTAPVATLVAGYVALVALLSRSLPVRVALPAAFLVQNAIYLVLVLVHPLVTSGPLRPGVALVVLTTPCLAMAWVLLRHRVGRAAGAGPGSGRGLLLLAAAASVGGVVMVVTVLLAARQQGAFSGVAWTASGDARFHLLFVRDVIAEGGLYGRPFTYQPQYQEALTALLLDSHGRAGHAPGPLLEHDLDGLAQTSVALTVLWTLAGSMTLLGFARLRGPATAAVLVAASLLPLTGLGLGVLLRDGFLPILLLVPLVLAALSVLSWLQTTQDTGAPVTCAVGATAAALPVICFTWTPFAVILGVAALLPWWRSLQRCEGRVRTARLAMMLTGAAGAAAYCVVVLVNAREFLHIDGAITAPLLVTVLLVPVLVVVVAAGGLSTVPARAFVPYLVGTVATAAITLYAALANPGGAVWDYFPSKIAWIWTLVGLPLLLVPFAHPRASAAAPRPGSPRGRPGVVAAAGALVVVVGASALSPLTSPILPTQLAWTQGGRVPAPDLAHWTQPDAGSLARAVRLGDARKRYVVFGVDPTHDRITNFWLAAYEPRGSREFFDWTYTAQTTIQDICALHELQPDRIVVTTDPRLRGMFRRKCGLTSVRVELLPPS